MEKCLLSVDWDYFVYLEDTSWGSYVENRRSLVDLWYKRYIEEKTKGRDIEKAYKLSLRRQSFWQDIRRRFSFAADVKAYVSDSHALSYEIAKECGCSSVCLFDAHADLGYGGLASLNFEVNCSNWLGMLLKDRQIGQANIFYSPHSTELPEYFEQINRAYNVKYCSMADFGDSPPVSAVHICRSGAWTPPWFDDKFDKFADALGITYEIIDCPKRNWDPENLDFSQEILYLLA